MRAAGCLAALRQSVDAIDDDPQAGLAAQVLVFIEKQVQPGRVASDDRELGRFGVTVVEFEAERDAG